MTVSFEVGNGQAGAGLAGRSLANHYMTGAEAVGQPGTQSDPSQGVVGHSGQMSAEAAGVAVQTAQAGANGQGQDYAQWAAAMQAYYKAQPQAAQPNAATAYYAHMTQQPNPYAQMWAGQVRNQKKPAKFSLLFPETRVAC